MRMAGSETTSLLGAQRATLAGDRHTLIREAVTDDRLVFAGIVLFAVAIRFVAIGAHLSTDDGYSYIVGSAPSSHAFLQRLAASENTAPLFYLLLTPLRIGHAAWLRAPAAIPGVLSCVVLYLGVRRPLGVRAALLATLAVAVAPLAITYSDLSRGFMLDDLALLLALWAILKLSNEESWAWWLIYVASSVIALYTEYDAAIFLAALTATALLIGAPSRRRMALLGPLPLLALAPWVPQILRAQQAVNATKLAPSFPGPSLGALRDLAVTLALGEKGGVASHVGRWLEFGLIIALAAAALITLRHTAGRRDATGQRAIALIAGTGALTLIGHAIAGAAGVHLFTSRYLTVLIPLVATLGAAAILSTSSRMAIIAASVLLATLGVMEIERRYHHEWEPDLKPVRIAALELHPATVLTNSSVVVYYLKSLRPQLDRPFNLGPGRAQSCRAPCLIIDDARVRGGAPRAVSGSRTVIGPFELALRR